MRKFTSLLFSALLLCHINVHGQRGSIVDATPVASLSPAQIMQTLMPNMDPGAFALTDLFTYKNYSVNAVKVIYNTIDGKGNPTFASGVVFLPVVSSTTFMPVFSYLHGTLTRDLDAPSYLMGLESAIGWIMAMDGYISVLPDYLGLGDGPGFHPYQHAGSEATASIDMLTAAMLLCESTLTKPNGDLYLSGYSQGAHAALATQSEIQKNPLPGLTLRKTVAGSGAYSLSAVQKKYIFDHPEYPSPSFLPYLLLGYQEVYGNLYSDIGQVFTSTYQSIPALFNGLQTVDQINAQLPALWKTMFVPAYLWNIQYNYFHPVNSALRKNDVINWKPKSDLHLYYCTCDELVAVENSLLAYMSFILKGSYKVSCLPVGPFKHAECAPFVLLLAKIQFDCASGVNPCGINLLSLLKSASEKDLTDFTLAVQSVGQFPYLAEIMENKEIEAMLREPDEPESIRVYPNPARDMAILELPLEKGYPNRLQLFDIQGRIIIDKTCTENKVQLDLRPVPTGIYNLVINGSTALTERLIVIK